MLEAPEPDVAVTKDADGTMSWYRPSESDKDPVFRIAMDGTLTVLKLGADEEAAKLFWESVNFAGSTYSQRLHQAEQMITALYHDPCRQTVFEGAYDVFKVLKEQKTGVSMNTVRTVLDAVKTVCGKEVN